uniref:Glyoxalase/fosfomycin resistance/dioxygenase domain-containing protein n=1 Tax=Glycine max TaxID=3847 RepID=A0A0R0FME2_SOYBN
MANPLQLKSLNHISIVCASVEKSVDFYVNVLGFSPIKRPSSLDFNGAWLFNYGIGIHLLQSEDPEGMPKLVPINPKDNHISFQHSSGGKRLQQMKIEYVKNRVEENGMMIEICNCDNIPVVPLPEDKVWSCSRFNCNIQNRQQQI